MAPADGQEQPGQSRRPAKTAQPNREETRKFRHLVLGTLPAV
jgi:hypothetical protein